MLKTGTGKYDVIMNHFLSVEREADIIIDPYHYNGFGIHDSECRVEIWKEKKMAFILFTDKGKGASVTNAAEQLVQEIWDKFLSIANKDYCYLFETYNRKEAIDFIIPTWDKDKVVSVTWKHFGKVIN
jgi:hypothetical protein